MVNGLIKRFIELRSFPRGLGSIKKSDTTSVLLDFIDGLSGFSDLVDRLLGLLHCALR